MKYDEGSWEAEKIAENKKQINIQSKSQSIYL